MAATIQIILFGLAKALQRFVFWLIAFPVLVIASTPVILIRAWVLALRKRQRVRHAVADGYDFPVEPTVAATLSSFRGKRKLHPPLLMSVATKHLTTRCNPPLAGMDQG